MIRCHSIKLADERESKQIYVLARSVVVCDETDLLFESYRGRKEFLSHSFPDIYSWLCLNSSERSYWDLGLGEGILYLMVDEDLNEAFRTVWCDDAR